MYVTCSGSATELGAFHDGRDGMHVARVVDRRAWFGMAGVILEAKIN